jgi:nitric oxide reductase subunit C
MTVKTAKWIFWTGTLISLVLFLVLTVDTQRQFAVLTHADRLDENVVAGKRAFERHNCNDCHTILGFGAYYAPDLTRVYTRLGEASIRRRLEHPEVVFADSYRKMPQQDLTGDEISSIIDYLRWVSGIENNDWPPQHSEKRWESSTRKILARAAMTPGAALIQQGGCLACHKLGSEGGERGPRFEWIGTRREAVWIADYLKDPGAYAPGTEMPSYNQLSEEQRMMIGEFIVSLGNRYGR